MKRIAQEGQTWVCAACGKHGKDPTRIGDESCYPHAVLCVTATLKFHRGLVVEAQGFGDDNVDVMR